MKLKKCHFSGRLTCKTALSSVQTRMELFNCRLFMVDSLSKNFKVPIGFVVATLYLCNEAVESNPIRTEGNYVQNPDASHPTSSKVHDVLRASRLPPLTNKTLEVYVTIKDVMKDYGFCDYQDWTALIREHPLY